MTRRNARNRKRKRFQASSISALLPGTLDKGRKRGQSQQTKRQPRRKRRSKFLARITARWEFSHYFAALLATIGLLGVFLLFTDPRFAVETPIVSGNQYTDTNEIISMAAVDHANIFTVNPDQITARLSLIPQIQEAHVRLGLPNRVSIDVMERAPMVLYVREGEAFWVDMEGKIFPAAELTADLPVLLDDDNSASMDGKRLDPSLIQAITTLNASMPELTEFRYRRDYGLYFLSPEGWRVFLGDADHMTEKLLNWQSIRQQLIQQGRQIEIVDLRFNNVYVR